MCVGLDGQVEKWTAVCGEVDGRGREVLTAQVGLMMISTDRGTQWQTHQKQLQIRATSTVAALEEQLLLKALVKTVLQKEQGMSIVH